MARYFNTDHKHLKANANKNKHDLKQTEEKLTAYLDRLDRQRERFGFDVWGVGLDAGYYTAGICKGLEDRGIYGVMGYRRPNKPKGYLPKRAFMYGPTTNTYQCPQGQSLIYATTNRLGYREYKSNPSHCKECALLDELIVALKQQTSENRGLSAI